MHGAGNWCPFYFHKTSPPRRLPSGQPRKSRDAYFAKGMRMIPSHSLKPNRPTASRAAGRSGCSGTWPARDGGARAPSQRSPALACPAPPPPQAFLKGRKACTSSKEEGGGDRTQRDKAIDCPWRSFSPLWSIIILIVGDARGLPSTDAT